jgi:peptidoglycan/xylan/chitin deacetylase (PgdA/CDA1 family)
MSAVPKVRLVQCWDDGVLDDIRLTEILRKHKATASFNLNAGRHGKERHSNWRFRGEKDVWTLALSELTSVYEGFTIANHTWKHPHLTKLSVEEARQEIETGRDALEQLFGCRIEGFVYPFGDRNDEVRELVRSSGHLYARTAESARSNFPTDDPMEFMPNCHVLAPNFWEEFENVRQKGGIFYFWGHSYELVTEDQWRDFDNKIARLSAEGEWENLPDLFRTAPARP